MTDTIPYKAIGTRVYRGVVIGWASQEHDAAAFARELNALQSENARLRAKVDRLEAVERAARDALDIHHRWVDCDVSLGTLYDAMERLRTALETTDGE